MPQYPPYISERQMDTTHLPQSTLEKLHGDDGVVLRKPGELGPAPTAHGPLILFLRGRVWVPDHRQAAPGSEALPAGNRSGGETYPTTGDPAVDEAIRQTVSNLVDIRDAHGTGQSPVGGDFTDGATKVQGIQQNIQRSAAAPRAAGSATPVICISRSTASSRPSPTSSAPIEGRYHP